MEAGPPNWGRNPQPAYVPCAGRESNLRPFGARTMLQPTEPHRPGPTPTPKTLFGPFHPFLRNRLRLPRVVFLGCSADSWTGRILHGLPALPLISGRPRASFSTSVRALVCSPVKWGDRTHSVRLREEETFTHVKRSEWYQVQAAPLHPRCTPPSPKYLRPV